MPADKGCRIKFSRSISALFYPEQLAFPIDQRGLFTDGLYHDNKMATGNHERKGRSILLLGSRSMLPAIVFVVMVVPFVWAMFLCVGLGRSMKRQRVMDQLSFGRGLWPELFRVMPEAKPRVTRILVWFGISVAWWLFVMLAVGVYLVTTRQ